MGFKEKKRAYNEIQVLLRERQHRSKNNMQLLSSVLSLQTTKATENSKHISIISEQRVQSIILLDKLLNFDDNKKDLINIRVYIKSIVNGLLEVYEIGKKIHIDEQIENINIVSYQATYLGLIVNETITNSLKYAFSEVENPEIIISCSLEQNEYCKIIISDNGPGLPKNNENFQTESLGLRLIETMCKQLKAEYALSTYNGFSIQIRFLIESNG